ncbi:MAG: cell wall-active antibiotics response protein LiaF [Saccharofermentanales bacterium]
MNNIWKILAGIVLVTVGGVFILANFGLFPLEYGELVQYIWPGSVLLFSLALLVDGITKKGSRSKRFDRIYFALSVMVVGAVMLFNRLNDTVAEVKEFLKTDIGLWEVLLSLALIFVGIRLIFFKKSGITVTIGDKDRHHVHGAKYCEGCDDEEEDEDEDEDRDEKSDDAGNTTGYGAGENRKSSDRGSAEGSRKGVYTKSASSNGKPREQFIGELRLGDKPWAPESSDYSVNIGDMNVNFTTAILQDGETVFHLTGWVGNMDILLPEELAVDIDATVNVGSVEFFGEEEQSGISRSNIKFCSDGYDTASKKIKIVASLNVGEISVKRV